MAKDKFSPDLSGDAFDLLALGILPDEEEEAPDPEEEDLAPHVSPLTDMDSLDFYLWVQEGVEEEAARRKAQAHSEKDTP